MVSEKKLVEVKGVSKAFAIKGAGQLKAVSDVTFDIHEGEILGLVGESGCGKTTLGRTIKALYPADTGSILFDGKDITRLDREGARRYARDAQMIFQDPYSSLNPRMTVAELIGEGPMIHKLITSKRELGERVFSLLEMVGLNREHASRFPHEFSGGQRQRIGIARALALNPRFLVCDEPISALDVSIQAQVINLFKALKDRLNLTYLFVAHDLAMVKYISDRVAVMYLGRIVEIAPSQELYRNPMHPYTKFLLSAIPIPDPKMERVRDHVRIVGDLPSPINLPAGCSFMDRCKFATEDCRRNPMALREVAPGHLAACDRSGIN